MSGSVVLAVADIEASIAFYTRALGFEHGFSMPDGTGAISLASARLGEAEIMFGLADAFVAPEYLGLRGIGVQVYIELPDEIDIEALYQQALDNGVNITEPITERAWGDHAFTILDPDGYNLMFAQQPKAP